MEDLIYIILAVIWIVVGVMGNKKKKRTQQQQKQQQQEQQDSQQHQTESTPKPKTEFETIFEDIFGDTKPEDTAEQQKPVPTATAEYREYEDKEKYNFDYEQKEASKTYEKYTEGFKVESDYEFSAQKAHSIEDMIKTLERADANRPTVYNIDRSGISSDDENDLVEELLNDPEKAILYSEIINRRY